MATVPEETQGGGLIGDLITGGGYWAGYDKLRGDYKDLQNDLMGPGGTFEDIYSGIMQNTNFTPWSVKSRMGHQQYNPVTGNINMTLSPQQKTLADQLMGQSRDLMKAPMQDRGAREGEIYERIRAMQRPGEERAQQGLANQELNRGRSGMFTNQAGGTPEQLAMQKAMAESRNTAGFQAMGQAEQEMMNQYNMGRQMFQDQYTPMQQQLALSQLGMNQSQMMQHGDLQRAGLLSQLGLGQASTMANLHNIDAKMFTDMLSNVIPAASGLGNNLGGYLGDKLPEGGFWDILKGVL